MLQRKGLYTYSTGHCEYEQGEKGGLPHHTLTIEEMPSHRHTTYLSGGSTPERQAVNWSNQGYQEFSGITKANDNVSGGNQPHTNMQPYEVDKWIIKAFQSAGVVATVVDTLTSTSAIDALSAGQGKILNDKIESNSGTWTPTIGGTTTFGTATYNVKSANYIKTGKLLILDFKIGFTAMSGGSGLIKISGWESLGTVVANLSGVGGIIVSGATLFPTESTTNYKLWFASGLIISNGTLGGIDYVTVSSQHYIYGTAILMLQ